jgi:hypothetical protein
MESKLAGVARLLRRVGEELPASSADESKDVKQSRRRGSSTPRENAAPDRGTQIARLEQLRDSVADAELSIRTRGACSYAMHLYLMGNKHLLSLARQQPAYAQAVVGLINDIKETAQDHPPQAFDQIYLHAVETVALIYGKKPKKHMVVPAASSANASNAAVLVPMKLDDVAVESRADEVRNSAAQQQATRSRLNDVAVEQRNQPQRSGVVQLPSVARPPSSGGRLADVLSGQPIPRGATLGLFAEAFSVDAAEQLLVRPRVCAAG